MNREAWVDECSVCGKVTQTAWIEDFVATSVIETPCYEHEPEQLKLKLVWSQP